MSRYSQIPQQSSEEEMEAAFNGSGDEDEEEDEFHESHETPLLPSHRRGQSSHSHAVPSSSQYSPVQEDDDDDHPLSSRHARVPSASARRAPSRTQSGTYDFEYDYASLPPPGSPPRPSALALPNSFGNSNGLLPSGSTISRFQSPNVLRRALGAILPTHYARDRRGGGMLNDGVFANVVAKPVNSQASRQDGDSSDPHMVPEFESKDAPPSYQAAQQDTVPPYWETTILAPSGPLDGDMVIEHLPVGSVFVFLWNLLVSVSFQFVGFLLTYLLHTTHAGKYGSRAGLGITLIQYGFYMRSQDVQVPIATDDNTQSDFWGWPPEMAQNANSGGTDSSPSPTPAAEVVRRALPYVAKFVRSSLITARNETIPEAMPPIASGNTVFTAGDWLSFLLMTIGWFLLITSCLGFWRVKRWERSVTQSQAAGSSGQQPSSPSASSLPSGPFGHFVLPFSSSSSSPFPFGRRRRTFHGDPTPEDEARDAQVLSSLEAAFGIHFERPNSSNRGAATIESQRNARERQSAQDVNDDENEPLASQYEVNASADEEGVGDGGRTRGTRRFFRF